MTKKHLTLLVSTKFSLRDNDHIYPFGLQQAMSTSCNPAYYQKYDPKLERVIGDVQQENTSVLTSLATDMSISLRWPDGPVFDVDYEWHGSSVCSWYHVLRQVWPILVSYTDGKKPISMTAYCSPDNVVPDKNNFSFEPGAYSNRKVDFADVHMSEMLHLAAELLGVLRGAKGDHISDDVINSGRRRPWFYEETTILTKFANVGIEDHCQYLRSAIKRNKTLSPVVKYGSYADSYLHFKPTNDKRPILLSTKNMGAVLQEFMYVLGGWAASIINYLEYPKER